MLAFSEKRRAPNLSFKPIPLDFMESMSLPIKYQTSFCNGSPDVRTESVIMRSRDEGDTWQEIGRSDVGGLMNLFAYVSLPDGSILRGIDTDYIAFALDGPPVTAIEKSVDGGNTWTRSALLLEGDYSGYPYRIRRLRDGTLVNLMVYTSGFGANRPRRERGVVAPNVIQEILCGLWMSTDNGESWSGPMGVLPGILAPEPDFAELPSGDLLILNSRVQGGPEVRQYVHRSRLGFLPGPVHRVVSGTVPETFCVTQPGLLVGATRGSLYTCSNDEGATWHTIAEIPDCEYQPLIIELKDGRLLCAWHMHGDAIFGERHQFVGQHIFRLDASRLPAATVLDLTRDMNKERTQYTNAHTARLSAGWTALAGWKIRLQVQLRYADTWDLSPPRPEPFELEAVTDEKGCARFDLDAIREDFEKEVNIHQYYNLKAFFEPAAEDGLAPAESASYHSYIMTPEMGLANNYPLYVAGKKLFIAPEVLQEFPEIKVVVDQLIGARTFDADSARQALGLSGPRFDAVIAYLILQNLLLSPAPGKYEWRYQLTLGVEEIAVVDCFIAPLR
jgi:hypothetical protein